jgi:hypothetical protein
MWCPLIHPELRGCSKVQPPDDGSRRRAETWGIHPRSGRNPHWSHTLKTFSVYSFVVFAALSMSTAFADSVTAQPDKHKQAVETYYLMSKQTYLYLSTNRSHQGTWTEVWMNMQQYTDNYAMEKNLSKAEQNSASAKARAEVNQYCVIHHCN